MVGKMVSEEGVAHSLGFESVYEMRRWQTELGRKAWELGVELQRTRADLDSFRWHGRRMEKVLRESREYLRDLLMLESVWSRRRDHAELLILAVGVVLGEAVDWEHRLEGPLNLRVKPEEDRPITEPFVADTRLFRG